MSCLNSWWCRDRGRTSVALDWTPTWERLKECLGKLETLWLRSLLLMVSGASTEDTLLLYSPTSQTVPSGGHSIISMLVCIRKVYVYHWKYWLYFLKPLVVTVQSYSQVCRMNYTCPFLVLGWYYIWGVTIINVVTFTVVIEQFTCSGITLINDCMKTSLLLCVWD